jgi:hypothetical protein
LFVIQARQSPRAVIFRRGPSQHVLMCVWHTDTDRVEEGQWIRGRVYERRADLSPDGTKLLAFVGQYRRPMQTWSAISTPPWWTAHVVFPKGDAWGGGGLFDDARTVSLNHSYGDVTIDPSSKVPPKLRVRAMNRGRGGEDFPVYEQRLLRDGWRVVSSGKGGPPDFGAPVVWRYGIPWEYARARPRDPSLEVRMRILGVNERGGDWYVVEHHVVRCEADDEELVLDLGRAEWADWDARGDLVWAKDGVLYRARPPRLDTPRVVADLRDRTFEARPCPPSARVWSLR